MTSEVQVFAKDKIRLNILRNILGGMINVSFQQNNSMPQDYASQITLMGKESMCLASSISLRMPMKVILSPFVRL